ncbi:hypothetical protein ACSSWA_01460 [Melioribacter sp. Ez-97]|uniref:hypothetical protein n=1 Tax=Melioribacter sp. Ez-97 TaxID=3423434 RepID=UPI003ED8D273
METNNIVYIGKEYNRADIAHKYDELRRLSKIVNCYTYWQIYRHHLFIELGYNNIYDYARQKDNYSKGYVNKLIKIGNCFFTYIEENTDRLTREQELNLNDITNWLTMSYLSSIPIRNLYPLTRLPEKQRERLVKEGIVIIRGKVRTINELKKLTDKEISLLMRKKPLIKIKNDELTPEIAHDKVATHINAISEIAKRCTFLDKTDAVHINNCFDSLINVFKRHIN